MGADASLFGKRMDEVQASLDTDLKTHGFRRSKRAYNRGTEPGLVQVIEFQMGRHELPRAEPSPIPSLMKRNLYGFFTVNLGIHVLEVRDTIIAPKGPFVSEADCMIRARLGMLIDAEGSDLWWPLDRNATELAGTLRPAILGPGLALLDRFATRDAIISGWAALVDAKAKAPRIRLDVGIILAHAGRTHEAATLFREHLQLDAHHPSHRAYVESLAAKLQLGPL
jgi:hypothetical protein